LTTVVMAASSTAPVLVCPAMNPRMWDNGIVRENVQKLRNRGFLLAEPEEGEMACGDSGKGRLAELSVILERIKGLLA